MNIHAQSEIRTRDPNNEVASDRTATGICISSSVEKVKFILD
jgi:hypothetical protein